MARPLRIEIPDGVYHVTSRGLARRLIVRDDQDRLRWLELLDAVAARRRWRVFAWVLMDNHFHLFLRTPQADLSAGMHDLNSGYATRFNRRHRRSGPLFQGRFKAILVQRDYHYWELTRYIHLNPVRAGMVKRPERYVWGSCRFYINANGAPAWLAWEEVLREHGRKMGRARRGYMRFLADGITSPPESPMLDATASTVLGSKSFVAKVRDWLEERLPDRDVPVSRELRRRVDVDSVIAAVSRAFGVEESDICRPRKWGNEGRAAAIYLCRKLTDEPIGTLGERFGGVCGQAISKTAAQAAGRIRRDRGMGKIVQACENALLKKQKVEI
ncbi:MAG: transposase [Planctomycetota bacterium]